jgi:hypothetical protein
MLPSRPLDSLFNFNNIPGWNVKKDVFSLDPQSVRGSLFVFNNIPGWNVKNDILPLVLLRGKLNLGRCSTDSLPTARRATLRKPGARVASATMLVRAGSATWPGRTPGQPGGQRARACPRRAPQRARLAEFRALRRQASSRAGVSVDDLRSDMGASDDEQRCRLTCLPRFVKSKALRHVVPECSPRARRAYVGARQCVQPSPRGEVAGQAPTGEGSVRPLATEPAETIFFSTTELY